MKSYIRLWLYFADFFEQLIARKPYYLIETEVHISNNMRRSVTPIQMIAFGIGGIIGK
jgi:hypothetical protein